MPNSRSKAMTAPSAEIDGHSTRPEVNDVSAVLAPEPSRRQMFSLPLRSLMKNSVCPSRAHIGHSALAPRSTSVCTAPFVTSVLRAQISDWSMWLWPLRHHWPAAMPRAL